MPRAGTPFRQNNIPDRHSRQGTSSWNRGFGLQFWRVLLGHRIGRGYLRRWRRAPSRSPHWVPPWIFPYIRRFLLGLITQDLHLLLVEDLAFRQSLNVFVKIGYFCTWQPVHLNLINIIMVEFQLHPLTVFTTPSTLSHPSMPIQSISLPAALSQQDPLSSSVLKLV